MTGPELGAVKGFGLLGVWPWGVVASGLEFGAGLP